VTSELRRSIGLVQASAMVVGTIIGAAVFVQPSVISAQVSSAGAVAAVWIVAGALTVIGALITAELASAFPHTGGVYVFLREAFSPALGFLWGWAMFWSMHSGIIAAIAMIFASYVGHFAPLGGAGLKAVAVAAVLALSAINYVGVQHGSRLQTAFTIGKVLGILAIIAIGLTAEPVPGPTAAAALPPARDFALALVAGLFAFGGWHMVTYAAGETVRPERTIPRALLLGTLLVTACYVALNAVYFRVLPHETMATSQRVAADAASAVVGPGAASAVSGLVVFSTFGALSGIVLAGPRVYYSMARDGLLFRWVGAVHPRYLTPHRAIVLQAAWTSVLLATGTYRALFTRVIYTEWIFFGLMAVGLILLRAREGYAPTYRLWGQPVLPALFALSSAAIVCNQLVAEPREAAFGLAVVAAGLPIYRYWTRHAHH
jgi:APA family basic amino acid/polyamine antiporter